MDGVNGQRGFPRHDGWRRMPCPAGLASAARRLLRATSHRLHLREVIDCFQDRDCQRGNLYRTSSVGPLPPDGVSRISSPGCISSYITVQQVGIEWPRAG